MNDNFYQAFYNFPISKEMLDNSINKDKNFIRIQINNSCDESTLEILDDLQKYKDKNVKITTVLSYGKLKFKDEIIKKGRLIYNDKFEYIDQIISPVQYAQYLAQNDILILNQNRQQGFGNTLASLYLGKKVFIRQEVSTNKYLNNEGIKIFDTNNIVKMSFNELIEYKEKYENKIKVLKYYNDEYLVKLWRDFFYD